MKGQICRVDQFIGITFDENDPRVQDPNPAPPGPMGMEGVVEFWPIGVSPTLLERLLLRRGEQEALVARAGGMMCGAVATAYCSGVTFLRVSHCISANEKFYLLASLGELLVKADVEGVLDAANHTLATFLRSQGHPTWLRTLRCRADAGLIQASLPREWDRLYQSKLTMLGAGFIAKSHRDSRVRFRRRYARGRTELFRKP